MTDNHDVEESVIAKPTGEQEEDLYRLLMKYSILKRSAVRYDGVL
jgi:hypothetical protein